MPDHAIAISYCSTCKGRLYQLRETLAHNLAAIGPDEEITIADLQSGDGLAEWVWANFSGEIAAGRLRYFEALDETPWHAAKAKNLAHRLGQGAFLFNLDVDNFLMSADLALIRAAAAKGVGCRQGTGSRSDGTPGRIGIQRSAFYEIGGYDEGLLGVLVEDFDLIVRAEAAGHKFLRLGPPARMPLQNDIPERLGQYVKNSLPGQADLERIGRVGMALSQMRREFEGPCRRQNFATYRGRLNGETVILDGLGNLHPAG
jgi:hypothetical protein